MIEHVKISLENYDRLKSCQKEVLSLRDEVRTLTNKNKEEAYVFLGNLIVRLKEDGREYMHEAVTKSGYTLIYKTQIHGTESRLGSGEKIIIINLENV